MKVSILGDGLTSLSLAKALANQGINVDIFCDGKAKKYSKIQTLGISKGNVDFFNKDILNINKLLWNIDKIKVYSENLSQEKILDFQNDNGNLFSIVRNYDLYNFLLIDLRKKNLIKFKKKINYNNLVKTDYKLIFNCDSNNLISQKFFYKKITKNYNSFAHATSFKHKKILNNNIATQIFTKKGPIAFLPISPVETSVVYSVKGKKNIDLNESIEKYNTKYKIIKINDVNSFKLKSSNLRSYYYKNIIAFGDSLHKLHPLAGQGFNMIIRDIREILRLIEYKKEHGLDLDNSICIDFEKNIKNKNFLFSSGIDLIYEFFNIESKTKYKTLSKSVKFLNKNKFLNNFFKKFADSGMTI